jgi:hypothetical protein
MENHQRFSAFGFFQQDSHTAGARERRNDKKTSLCFGSGKGALAVNLLVCLRLL